MPLDEFRTFIALHEATHAFEFEAYPWLRDHFAASVAEAVELLGDGRRRTDGERLKAAARRRRGALAGADDAAPQLRQLPAHAGAHVAARGLLEPRHARRRRAMLPGFAQLHARFERRNEHRGALERTIMRLTGLDLKMEQYAAGERFVDAVLARRDRAFLNRVWTGPDDAADASMRSPTPIAGSPAWKASR